MNLRAHLTERNSKLSIGALFLVCSVFIMAHPHSFQNATVPDERSYYDWGQLYNQGIWHVPLYDWYGVKASLDYHVNSSGLFYLVIDERLIDADAGKKDIEVKVTFQDGSPVAGAEVRVSSQRPRLELSRVTNATGDALFMNVPKSVLGITAVVMRPAFGPRLAVNLGAFDLYDLSGVGEPYGARFEITDFALLPSGYSLGLKVTDLLEDPIPGADVLHSAKGSGQNQPLTIGSTDADGSISISSDIYGSQTAIARKEPMRRGMPIASVVPYGDSYVAVNHWAPGYSVILGLLDRVGAAVLTGMLMMAMAAISTYLLARRLFDWRVAFVSTSLLLTCGVALLILWTVGMADYASMAFALAGIWLLVEAVWVKRRWFVSASLGLLGGMSFGVGIWIRYSTASLLVALAFLMLALSFNDLKALRTQAGRLTAVLRRLLFRSLPFLAGMAILLVPLAMYNSAYFGGPLGASHNYGGRINIDTSDGNTTATLVTGSVYSNFDPADAMSTMGTRLLWLLIVMPILILLPMAIYLGWRRLSVLFLLAWFLSNFLLYIFVPWVASWWEMARSLEDTRYFLPSLPPAAMLGGFVITDAMLIPKKRRMLGVAVLSVFLILGFVVAQAGIDAQMRRGNAPLPGGPPPPPPQMNYTLATVNQFLSNPNPYKESLVRVNNCTFDDWINSTAFLFRDASSGVLLRADLVGYTPPTLIPGAHFHVQGMFHWFDGNHDSVPQPPELFISVKGGTTDAVTLD